MASITLRLKPEGTWLATASRVRLRCVAVGVAFISFVVTQALHWVFFPLDNLEQLGRRMAGDALAAILIGLLLYRVLLGVHDRRRATLERLQLIAELNHHIRNSLQAIQFSAQTLDQDGAIRQIDESVQRISRVLSEIIPMSDQLPPPDIRQK